MQATFNCCPLPLIDLFESWLVENEPPHDKTNKMTRALSEDSDQPGHPPSLISLRCPHEEILCPQLLIERTTKTDQTGRMSRLVWFFAGRTCHFVGFIVRRLKYVVSGNEDARKKWIVFLSHVSLKLCEILVQ